MKCVGRIARPGCGGRDPKLCSWLRADRRRYPTTLPLTIFTLRFTMAPLFQVLISEAREIRERRWSEQT